MDPTPDTPESRDARRARLLDKIRKLRNLGADARGNEHETEAALRQAAALMAQHAIAEAELDMRDLDAGAVIMGECDVRPDGCTHEQAQARMRKPMKDLPGWAGTLAVGCAQFCDCQVIGAWDRVAGRVLRFQGEKGDVTTARWLFGVLIASINNAQAASHYHGRSDATAFRSGAAGTLQVRLKRLAEERKATLRQAAVSGSRALVVVDRKRELIAAHFKVAKYGKGRAREFTSARAAGQVAGGRMNIPQGRPIGSNAPAKRIAG